MNKKDYIKNNYSPEAIARKIKEAEEEAAKGGRKVAYYGLDKKTGKVAMVSEDGVKKDLSVPGMQDLELIEEGVDITISKPEDKPLPPMPTSSISVREGVHVDKYKRVVKERLKEYEEDIFKFLDLFQEYLEDEGLITNNNLMEVSIDVLDKLKDFKKLDEKVAKAVKDNKLFSIKSSLSKLLEKIVTNVAEEERN